MVVTKRASGLERKCLAIWDPNEDSIEGFRSVNRIVSSIATYSNNENHVNS